MQESFGAPLPESIQFERCEAVADAALPIFLYLRRLAADGEVICSDDTRVRILSCLKENKELKEEEWHGTHTSGIVIEIGGRKIALYANGRRLRWLRLDRASFVIATFSSSVNSRSLIAIDGLPNRRKFYRRLAKYATY